MCKDWKSYHYQRTSYSVNIFVSSSFFYSTLCNIEIEGETYYRDEAERFIQTGNSCIPTLLSHFHEITCLTLHCYILSTVRCRDTDSSDEKFTVLNFDWTIVSATKKPVFN